MIKNKNLTHGFTLLEALLTTAVLSGLFFVIFGLIQNYTEQILAKSAANYMNNLGLAIEEILKNPVNFELIYAEVDAQANDIQEVTVTDIINGDIGTLSLSDNSLLNANTSTTTPLKTGISIMLRRAGNNALEIIIATDGRVNDKRVRATAEYSKLNGGFYRNTVDNIKSTHNAWSFDPAIALVGSNWWDTIAAPNPPSIDDGSYLIHYKHITFDEVAGDYLYRTSIAGRPELNRIYTNLNMGGQSILGADNINPTGDVEFQSNAIINGSMSVGNDVTIETGNLQSFGTLVTNNATLNNVAGGTSGNFIVQDNVNTTELNLTTNLNADSALLSSGLTTTGNISSTTIQSVNNINSDTVNTINLEGASSASRIDIDALGNLNTGIMQTPNFTLNGPRIPLAQDLIVNGDATITDEIIAPDFTIDVFNTNIFGLCDENEKSDC